MLRKDYDNELCGLSQFIRDSKMYLKLVKSIEHASMNVDACLDHLISLTEQCLPTECVCCEGPLHKTYGIACTSLGCVIIMITSSSVSSPFRPSLCLLGGQGSLLLPCAASVCVFDCGKIS